MITVDNITVRFGGVVALSGVSAEFTAPVAGIIGPNGAGKTTLMNVVSGFVQAAEGRIVHDGTDLLRLSPHRRARWGLRRSFQKEEVADDLTAHENVLVQTDHARGAGRGEEAGRLLELVGLADRAHVLGRELTGFERRLVDVARCMAGNPRLVMFDEPAGGLSMEETKRLGALLRDIHAQTGAQTLLIDHDVELIAEVCEEVLVLDFGKRIAFGPTDAVLADPKVKAAYLGTEEV
ncbi:ABC transporter ATP-binding protein [Rhodovulum sp. DZ06]|uniref:ABC transporter ATP-binding protein n=1 Tax=Rhodovulum sp. DZ06 TaxID=3425126 RepID=UPI003D34037D